MLGKEDATKIDLTKWFERMDSRYGGKKVQGLLFETFKVSGTSGRKPDLVIEKDGLYSAIEVKSGKTIETLQSRKIQEYYKDHSNGLSKYIINGNEV